MESPAKVRRISRTHNDSDQKRICKLQIRSNNSRIRKYKLHPSNLLPSKHSESAHKLPELHFVGKQALPAPSATLITPPDILFELPQCLVGIIVWVTLVDPLKIPLGLLISSAGDEPAGGFGNEPNTGKNDEGNDEVQADWDTVYKHRLHLRDE